MGNIGVHHKQVPFGKIVNLRAAVDAAITFITEEQLDIIVPVWNTAVWTVSDPISVENKGQEGIWHHMVFIVVIRHETITPKSKIVSILVNIEGCFLREYSIK